MGSELHFVALRWLLGAALLPCVAAGASTVDSPLFSIAVPDNWHVENNKESIILAMGAHVVDGVALPFLTVQYCVNSGMETANKTRACTEPCDQGLSFLTSSEKLLGVAFSAVTSEVRPGGITVYRVDAPTPFGGHVFAALSCSSSDQIYIALVSDVETEEAKTVFNQILMSVRRKTNSSNQQALDVRVLRDGSIEADGHRFQEVKDFEAFLRERRPLTVHVRPATDATYGSVSGAMKAIQDVGGIDVGLVGNENF